jgi:hypothetical protein
MSFFLWLSHIREKTMSFDFIVTVLTAILLLSSSCSARYSSRLIYQYPNVGTWFENAAVRSNGDILLTSLNNPGALHSLNPLSAAKPALVTGNFDGLNSTLGIVETYPDVFWVIASNFSLEPTTLGTQPGTNAIFKVVFDEQKARAKPYASASLLTYLPNAKFLNGLTKFNDTLLLAADSALGAIWGINTETGDYTIVAQDQLMDPKPVGGYGEGINGLHLHGNRLYFSNSQKHLFAYIDLDHNGYQKKPAVQLATPVIEQGVNSNWDDFTVDHSGQFAYIATEIGNTIQRIDLGNGKVDILAGGLNSTAIVEPTSVVFGRTHALHTLYAATAGGLAYPVYTEDGPRQFGAQVVAIDVGR